jgi:hypothetical protein
MMARLPVMAAWKVVQRGQVISARVSRKSGPFFGCDMTLFGLNPQEGAAVRDPHSEACGHLIPFGNHFLQRPLNIGKAPSLHQKHDPSARWVALTDTKTRLQQRER